VRLLAPEGNDGVATLTGLSLAHSVGMTLGGLVVLLILRRIMPAGFLRGFVRTLAVGTGTAVAGGLVGRLGVDAVLQLGEDSLVVAVMAALLGAVVVTLTTFLGIRTFDRAILASVRSAHG
jgi:putative peptidoglycan lipid II flippase